MCVCVYIPDLSYQKVFLQSVINTGYKTKNSCYNITQEQSSKIHTRLYLSNENRVVFATAVYSLHQ